MMVPDKPNLMRAQGAAFRINERFGVIRPGQLDVEDLAMALGVIVIYGRLDGAAGRLVRKGNSGIIRINSSISLEGAIRFAVSHELGHWELHAQYSQMFLCTEADMRDYDRSPLEIERSEE